MHRVFRWQIRGGIGQDNAVMATPEGFEPPTHSLEGCCSIQLSYGVTPPTGFSSYQLTGSIMDR